VTRSMGSPMRYMGTARLCLMPSMNQWVRVRCQQRSRVRLLVHQHLRKLQLSAASQGGDLGLIPLEYRHYGPVQCVLVVVGEVDAKLAVDVRLVCWVGVAQRRPVSRRVCAMVRMSFRLNRRFVAVAAGEVGQPACASMRCCSTCVLQATTRAGLAPA